MSNNPKQSFGSKPPPPPPPPRWAQNPGTGPSSPSGMSLPRALIIILTILGLFFIFRVVKNKVESHDTAEIPESASADMQEEEEGGESNPSSDMSSPVPPSEPSSSASANAQTDPSAGSPPTVNPAKLNRNLSAVEADIRRLQTLPDLTVYIRISNNMRAIALTQIAILESFSDARMRNADIQSLRSINTGLDEIDDDSYKTFSISAYSQFAAKAGHEVANAIATDKSDADLRTCAELLDTPADDQLIGARNGALALAYACISAGKTLGKPNASEAQSWDNYSRLALATQSSDDHILRQIEKSHQLLFDVIRSCCTSMNKGQETRELLERIESSHRSALNTSMNLYDKICAHSDASVQAMLVFAKNLNARY